jgi:TonB family protein
MPASLKPRRGPSPGSMGLAVHWESRRKAFWESFLAILRGPAPPPGWPVSQFFRDSWIRGPIPWRMMALSLLWHIAVVIFPLHTWEKAQPRSPVSTQKLEITWSGPLRDLPAYIPPRPRGKAGARDERDKLAAKGADAFHPRQTIVSAPPKINHPRQTLIQPNAPPEPPKILPPLPNIVQWAPTPQPVRPRLHVNARARLRQRARRRSEPVVAPEIRNDQTPPSEIAFAPTQANLVRPKLEVRTGAKPSFTAEQRSTETTPVPEVPPVSGGEASGQRLVALSAYPAPPPQNLEVPPGNLSARFAISPEGRQPGVPGGSSGGTGSTGGAGGTGSSGNGGSGGGNGWGIPGIRITGGCPDLAGNISGAGWGVGGLTPGLAVKRNAFPPKPEARDLTPGPRARQESILDRIKPGAPPEGILDPKRIYTLHVNMPNLTSATGSWVLKFVELEEEEKNENPAVAGVATDLAGPLPLRKVDPKYPPALISARIQGEVVLYAIIRRDGTVDSIQLIQSLDPQLDQNAMEALARWKFRAAERKGKPVELEAIVRIPFRPVSSLY